MEIKPQAICVQNEGVKEIREEIEVCVELLKKQGINSKKLVKEKLEKILNGICKVEYEEFCKCDNCGCYTLQYEHNYCSECGYSCI